MDCGLEDPAEYAIANGLPVPADTECDEYGSHRSDPYCNFGTDKTAPCWKVTHG